ncbi:DUF1161 domain-containing protein [Rhodanobacter sp. MP1X3]|jgi:hypothetical protein|uniref:DUF1161 domain-containing protein n=1 Tax=Rhodanobacter sp. MP1X3 TaxID=2723086 RepID=UPI00161B0C84|nr:DUF1161 domain-containing protein [Rhodanobacter sp. MP1X3]MBB6243506.1 hypothetical protein [Rhodanobacter sp. MP1X3]
MNKRFGMMALLLLALPVMAHASCDDVKSSIDAKIKAKGVSDYKLDVVSGDQADANGKVVGQCEGDKKIVYTRGEASSSDSSSSSSDSSSADSAAPADSSSAPAPTKPKHHHTKKAADDSAAPAPAASSGG